MERSYEGWLRNGHEKKRKHFPCQSATQPAITIGTIEQGVKDIKS